MLGDIMNLLLVIGAFSLFYSHIMVTGDRCPLSPSSGAV